MERETVCFEVGSAAIHLSRAAVGSWSSEVKVGCQFSQHFGSHSLVSPFFFLQHVICDSFDVIHWAARSFVPPIRPRDSMNLGVQTPTSASMAMTGLGSILKNPSYLQFFRLPSFSISSIFCPSFSERDFLGISIS
jgi:hypothetical protein